MSRQANVVRLILGTAMLVGASLVAAADAQTVRPGTGTRPPSSGYTGPTGTASPNTSNPNAGPTPNTAPQPTPGTNPGGPPTGPGTNPGATPQSTPGGVGPNLGGAAALPPTGGERPGRPGARLRRKGDKRGRSTPLNLPFPADRWENWWLLNRDEFLEIDRSYTTRARLAEPSRDEFLGTEEVEDPASPVSFHRRSVNLKLIPAILDKLNAASSNVRGEAALALGKVGGRQVVSALVPMTRDRNRFVRQMALLGLGLTQDHEARRPLMAFLVRQSNQAADRAHAALALGILGDPLALPVLSAILDQHGRSHELTGATLYALGFIPGEDSAVILEDFLARKSRRGSLRGAAVLGLGKLQKTPLVPRLVAALTDSETHVRRSAALALGGQQFISPLWQKRDVLLAKLKHWHDTEILSEGARREFEEILAELERAAVKETQSLQVLQDSVVKALKRALQKDSDQMVRNFAAIALGRIGGAEARLALDKLLRSESGAESKRGFVAMALGIARARESAGLLRALAAEDRLNPSVRGAVALAVGLIKDLPSGPLLLDVALSHKNTVRGYAAIACGLMNFKPARVPFREELVDEAQAYLRPTFGLALGLLGDHRAIEFLGRLITEKRAGITRIQAARALGSIHDKSSANILSKALLREDVTDMEMANFLNAAGRVAEKGSLPVLEPMARDWNYLLDFPLINAALLR